MGLICSNCCDNSDDVNSQDVIKLVKYKNIEIMIDEEIEDAIIETDKNKLISQ